LDYIEVFLNRKDKGDLNNSIQTDTIQELEILLTDLIRLFGTSPSGLGYTVQRGQIIAKTININ